MKNGQLYQGISNAAWGYFFLYFDIKLGTYVSVGMMVVYLIAGICLMVALFRLRRCFCEGDPAQ